MKNSLEPSIELAQIDPRTRYFSALGGAFLALIPVIPLRLVFLKFHWPLWLLLIYAVLMLVLVFLYAKAAHARFGYALLDDGLWLQSGVFWRKAVFVPRERVQHTEVNHGPLDRKMGLAKLVLHTAGLRLQHLTIPGLTDAQAHALRDNLLKRAPNVQVVLPLAPVNLGNAADVLAAPIELPLPALLAAPTESELVDESAADQQAQLASNLQPNPPSQAV